MTELCFRKKKVCSASWSSPKPCLCTYSELFALFLLSENAVFSICIRKWMLMDVTLFAFSASKRLHIRSRSYSTRHTCPHPATAKREAPSQKDERERENPLPRHLLCDFPAHQLEEYESGCCSFPIDGLIKAVGRVTLRESHLAN